MVVAVVAVTVALISLGRFPRRTKVGVGRFVLSWMLWFRRVAPSSVQNEFRADFGVVWAVLRRRIYYGRCEVAASVGVAVAVASRGSVSVTMVRMA